MGHLSLSPEARRQFIDELSRVHYDLLIVGGGINGAGAARDAASRGLRVALVEADDFASGTSSRSSKLIHGGIRYLESLEFGLVFEALSERQRLFEIAPHLVHPLRFFIPLYESGRVGMFKMGLGMWLYDALSLFQAPEAHQRWSRAEALVEQPFLREEGLLGAYSYFDAYMDDDRLTLETLRSAASFGARAVNFVEALGVIHREGHLLTIEVHDKISGQKLTVRARHILSTVGPWTDRVAPHLVPRWQNTLRPSKGVHLTFSRERFALKDAVVMAAEKRIVFAIPRHEMVIVGTTDNDYAQDPRLVRTEKEDVEYLLKVLRQYFPGAGITQSDVLASYAGVRPLVDDGARTESKTSREHAIWTDPIGVTFVAGGKYTTYRLMAEQAIESVLNTFSAEDQVRFARSQSLAPLNPLIDADSYAQRSQHLFELARLTDLSLEECERLLDRHGAEALQMAKIYCGQFSVPSLGPLEIEALHAIDTTMCLNLVDFYMRRTPLFLSEKDHGISRAARLAKIFAERLRWDKSEVDRQINATRKRIEFEMAWA